jgi:hypothetical protein
MIHRLGSQFLKSRISFQDWKSIPQKWKSVSKTENQFLKMETDSQGWEAVSTGRNRFPKWESACQPKQLTANLNHLARKRALAACKSQLMTCKHGCRSIGQKLTAANTPGGAPNNKTHHEQPKFLGNNFMDTANSFSPTNHPAANLISRQLTKKHTSAAIHVAHAAALSH